jgi:hypothetical protein
MESGSASLPPAAGQNGTRRRPGVRVNGFIDAAARSSVAGEQGALG